MARVLVVDDHAHVRGAVRRVLAKDGHEVWDVPDGTEALELLAILPFDLVITDVYMTVVGGMELLVEARRRGHALPVVAMSGGGFASREAALGMAKSCGAAATLLKPFSPCDLRNTVSSALRPAAA